MNIALVIEDGRTQLVLTPETVGEKAILEMADDKKAVSIHRGEYYACRGGWTRQGSGIESLIFVLDSPKPDEGGRQVHGG